MTFPHIIPGGNYQTTGFTLTDTSETTVYTVPSSGFREGIILQEIWAADEDGTANTLLVKVGIGGTDYTIGQAEVVTAASHVQLNPAIVMKAGDTIKLTAGSATIDGYVTVFQPTASV